MGPLDLKKPRGPFSYLFCALGRFQQPAWMAALTAVLLFKLTAVSQTLNGTVTADKISSVTMILSKSSLTSTVNQADTAELMSLALDAASTWNVTGTSYLTAFTDADTTLANIKDNGNTIYYDSTNSANS